MGLLNNRGLVLSMLVWATACSNVNFAPGGPAEKLSEAPEPLIEDFAFNDSAAVAKVDILFVDDNSGSMLDKQQKLGAKMSSFVASLANVDWQIAITTTDTSNGRYGLKGSFVDLTGVNSKVLTVKTPNFEKVFEQSIVRPEMNNCENDCPSDDERPLQALLQAVQKRNNENAGFFRDGADLVAVFLSDEDESYTELGKPTTPAQVLSVVRDAFPNKQFTAFGIVARPDDAECLGKISPVSGKASVFMAALIGMTGGVMGSVCDADYSSSLTKIGQRVRDNTGAITLKFFPLPDTVQLVVNPFDPELQWTIDGRSIRFNKLPKKGSTISVKYLAK